MCENVLNACNQNLIISGSLWWLSLYLRFVLKKKIIFKSELAGGSF